MLHSEHWRALATQIRGLQRAGELYAAFQEVQREDSYGAGAELLGHCAAVVRAIAAFRNEFESSLPSDAKARIEGFLKSRPALAAIDPTTGQRGARAALVALGAFEAEVTFILAGRQEQIRARSELALLHLQRTLAVDEAVSAKWMQAWEKHETACERLGSVHLLSHGIFAFKVDALGARTDLVFNEQPDERLLSRGVEGLVLTEWKVAENAKIAARAFAEARSQADRYKQGPLAGIELVGYRYLIVVSPKEIPRTDIPSDDVTQAGIVYRHVNIVVRPAVPSIAAKKRN